MATSTTIDDKTKIPIGWLFAAIAALSTVVWSTSSVLKGMEHVGDQVGDLKQEVVSLRQSMSVYSGDHKLIQAQMANQAAQIADQERRLRALEAQK